MISGPRILLVEDDEDDVFLTKAYLDESFGKSYSFEHVSNLPDALRRAKESAYDVFLVDYRLGSHNGIDFIQHINRDLKLMVPVILLTGQNNRETDISAMEAGATDYLVKQNIDARALERSIRYSMKQKQAEEHIQFLAYHDALTGLPNRTLLFDRLKTILARFARNKHYSSLLFLDLDNFKNINDSLGHSVGDALLIEITRRLNEVIREEDSISRLGGDEFIVLFPEISRNKEETAVKTQKAAERIIHSINQPIIVGSEALHIGTSIGITLFAGLDTTSPENILRHADTAMYAAKSAGKNTARFFQHEMENTVKSKLTLENELRKAISENQFEILYQPQVCVNSEKILGAEALVRWMHPEKGMISPVLFIPSAEQSGLIHPLGELVFRAVCNDLPNFSDIPRISVNISAKQFHALDFVEKIDGILKEYDASPEYLELELTESALLADIDDTALKMKELKDMGFTFALDDFGTGYSSLTYLKKLPFDVLKIDRSFITDIIENRENAGIATAVIALGKALHLSVVGEGVETAHHLQFLKDEGANSAQGYYISRPISATDLVTWINQRIAC